MLTINVCIGSACHLKGSYLVISKLQELIEKQNLKNEVIVKAAFCLGQCTEAVSLQLDDNPVVSVSPDNIEDFFEKNILRRF